MNNRQLLQYFGMRPATEIAKPPLTRPADRRLRLAVEYYPLVFILALFTGLSLLYDITVPAFEKPDELKHFAVIQYLHDQHRLPVVQAGIARPWDQEGTQPPLYHLMTAGLVSWLDLSDFKEPPRNPHYADERSFIWRERGNNNLYLHAPGETWSLEPIFLAVHLARWLSILAGLATIIFTYILANTVFCQDRDNSSSPAPLPPCSPASWLPLLAASLVAFIPQFLHTSSAISNDGLSAALSAAALVGVVKILKQGSSTRLVLSLGLLLGLSAITKLSLLYLAPLAGLVLLLDYRRHRSGQRLLAYSAMIAGLAGLLAGWWYLRNWQLYGDVTALNAHLLYRGGPLNPRPGLAQLWQTELTGLELSFWGAFGAGQILFEPGLYAVLRAVKYLVLAGVVVGLWRLVKGPGIGGQGKACLADVTRNTQQGPLPSLLLLILWTCIIFVALLRWMQITPASWGRLLYPTLPALAVLAAWGLAELGRLGTWVPKLAGADRVPVLPSLLALGLFVLASISPFYYIQAAYAKTPLVSEASVPGDIERVDLVYDGVLRLIGYRVEKSPVYPGDWLPVTLYWQATRPIAKNYSTFVHLLGPGQAGAGQANTYPDGGNWPTSMLPPGQVLPDTYYVPVSPEAAAPAVLRLALGIFEFDDPARAAKPAVNPAGQVVEPIVGRVPLLPPRWPELRPTQTLAASFGGQIRLIGYDWVNKNVQPGATVPITFYWETASPPGADLNLFIHLVDPATGTQAAGFDGPPEFPTGYWQPGYKLVDTRSLALPADLLPGEYEVWIGWYNLDGFVRLPLNGGGDALRVLRVRVGD